jgi:Spy/CpxP family protein refolding chaperone
MRRSRSWLAIGLAALGFVAADGTAFASAERPYAGLEARSIKSLSDQDADDLRAGRGMGMALPAELNGFPGPRHVLDLADRLALTPAQRERTAALFAAMQAESAALGEQVIAREAELDRMFAGGGADEITLRDLTRAIGLLRGDLRYTHLRYHLAVRAMLSAEQIEAYRQARGYGQDAHGGHGVRPH